MMRSLDVRSPAVAGGACEDDLLPSKIECEDIRSSRQQQALVEALVYFDAARLPILLGTDRLAEVGVGLEDDLAGDITEIIRDLRLIQSGHASIDDLRKPGLPDWAVEATVKWREERDRGSVRRPA
jgi:hypothetical protein